MRGAHRSAALDFVGKSAENPLLATDRAVTWQLGRLVALILDSPYHALR